MKQLEGKRIEKERNEKYQKLKGDAKDARAKYREKYIREVWPLVQAKLTEFKLKCELDVIEGEEFIIEYLEWIIFSILLYRFNDSHD